MCLFLQIDALLVKAVKKTEPQSEKDVALQVDAANNNMDKTQEQ